MFVRPGLTARADANTYYEDATFHKSFHFAFCSTFRTVVHAIMHQNQWRIRYVLM